MSIRDIIEQQKKTGTFFTIWFIKKDNTERKMTCRFGVKKHLHGGKATVSEDKYWIVWDTGVKDYRAVNKETVFRVKCSGVIYE